MSTPFAMPCRGEDTAPIFNKYKPRELTRFFDELEYLFERAWHQLGDDNKAKKRHTLRYVDFEIEEVWRTIPEFADPMKTYNQFKAAILDLYPDASEDNRYSLNDLDFLIGERLRLGINSVNNLIDFNMRFLAITNWLMNKRRLSDLEQQRSYIRAFQSSLLTSILALLKVEFPNQRPDEPHKVSYVYKAALGVLRSTPAAYRQYSLADMDILIGERLRLGIHSAVELDDFHKPFLEITDWLISRGDLSDLEQRRSYIRAFPPWLLTPIYNRLRVNFPNRRPDDSEPYPYKVSFVHKAAEFVLSAPVHPGPCSSPVIPSSSTRSPTPPQGGPGLW